MRTPIGEFHNHGRQCLGRRAFFESLARRLGGLIGGRAAVHEGGRLGGENLFRLVDLVAFEGGETGDLIERQHGEQLEKADDVAVLGVAPVLPVVVRADQIGIEPDGAGRRLAHLGAGRSRDQRRGQRKQLRVQHAAAEIDAVDDVAPLIGAAHLQNAAVALVELDEIVGLQHHVVEFEKREFLLAVEPQLHRVERRACG